VSGNSRLTPGLVCANAPPHNLVGIRDQLAQGVVVQRLAGAQLHVPHALARAFEQAGGIGKRRAQIEADIGMRLERVDVCKGGIAQARHGTAIVHEFANVGTAAAHALEPRPDHQPQWVGDAQEPGLDRGISSNRAGVSQKIVHARHTAVASGGRQHS